MKKFLLLYYCKKLLQNEEMTLVIENLDTHSVYGDRVMLASNTNKAS